MTNPPCPFSLLACGLDVLRISKNHHYKFQKRVFFFFFLGNEKGLKMPFKLLERNF